MDPAEAVQYGALGLLATGSMTVAGVLWRNFREERLGRHADQKAFTTKLAELAEQHSRRIEELLASHRTEISGHKAEIRALSEQLVESAVAQVREYHTLVERVTEVVGSLGRKITQRGR